MVVLYAVRCCLCEWHGVCVCVYVCVCCCVFKSLSRSSQLVWQTPCHRNIQQLVGSVAIAVQRGTAMSYLDGYERSMNATGAKASTSACTVEVIDDDDEDDAAAEHGRELVRKRK